MEKTAFCGQAFRFKKLEDEKTLGIFEKNLFIVKQDKKYLTINCFESKSLGKITSYLGLSVPATKVKEDILASTSKTFPAQANLINNIIKSEAEIRILKQPVLETCLSYILSVNSNIPLISRRIENLSQLFSKNKTYYLDNHYYFFPTLRQLKTLDYEALKDLKLGFRTDWIWEFIKRTDIKTLSDLVREEKETRKKYFTSFAGIGEKVFNCINLYAYNDYTSFPVDVWIRRSLKEYLDFEAKPNTNYEKYFGKYCGYFQQYLYNYSRNKKNLPK
jgi:N-glycosylase/DNA lyase